MRYFIIDTTTGLPARARGFVDFISACEAAQESANYLNRRVALLQWDSAFLDLNMYFQPKD